MLDVVWREGDDINWWNLSIDYENADKEHRIMLFLKGNAGGIRGIDQILVMKWPGMSIWCC